MFFEKEIYPFDLEAGEKYFIVYYDKESEDICSISLEQVEQNDETISSGKRIDVAIDYHNKPKNAPATKTYAYSEAGYKFFNEFKSHLEEMAMKRETLAKK